MGCSSIRSSTAKEQAIGPKASQGVSDKNNQKTDEQHKKYHVTVSEVKTSNKSEEVKVNAEDKVPQPRTSAPKIEDISQKKNASPPKNVPIPEPVLKSKPIEDPSPKDLIKVSSLAHSQVKIEEKHKNKPQEMTVDQWLENLYTSVKSQLSNKV